MNLTNEEIRIKIAEACGWTGIRGETGYPTLRACEIGDYQALPNYPEDLNACAEFEAALTDEERRSYFFHLFGTQRLEDGDLWKAVSATARQRCLAYLKKKGLIP